MNESVILIGNSRQQIILRSMPGDGVHVGTAHCIAPNISGAGAAALRLGHHNCPHCTLDHCRPEYCCLRSAIMHALSLTEGKNTMCRKSDVSMQTAGTPSKDSLDHARDINGKMQSSCKLCPSAWKWESARNWRESCFIVDRCRQQRWSILIEACSMADAAHTVVRYPSALQVVDQADLHRATPVSGASEAAPLT